MGIKRLLVFIILLFAACRDGKKNQAIGNDIIVDTVSAVTDEALISDVDTLERYTKKAFADSGRYILAPNEVTRHLRSSDSTYLNIVTNVFNIRGNYLIPSKNGEPEHNVNFEGFQKKKGITFSGFNPESYYEPLYHFKGELNTDSGYLSGNWKINNKEGAVDEYIKFDPIYFQFNPNLKYRLFTVEIAHELYINKIQVLDTMNNAEVQILEGFIARPVIAELAVEDLNFDGWFDLRIREDVNIKSGRSDRELFWLYNPETRQYVSCKMLDDIRGTYHHIDEKTQTLILSNRAKNGNANYFGFKFNGLLGHSVTSPY